MIWLNIEKLEENISNDKLSNKDGFNYVLAYFILSAISFAVGYGDMSGSIRFIGAMINVVITIWGLNAIYKINLDIDGKDFFKRFFSIFWVIGMRVLVAALVISIFAGILIAILLDNGSNLSSGTNPMIGFVQVIFTSLYSIIVFLMMNSFRKLNPKAK